MPPVYLRKDRVTRHICRRLVKNFMDVIILSELKERQMSGYDIICIIYEQFHLLFSSGTVYFTIYRLERDGLIRGRWSARKRVYTLTPKGENVLKEIADSHRVIQEVVARIFSKITRGEFLQRTAVVKRVTGRDGGTSLRSQPPTLS